MAVFILVKQIQAAALFEVLRTAQWKYLTLGILLLIPNIWIQALKWQYLLKWAHPCMPFANSFKSLLIGYPLGFTTPGRFGEIGRSFFIKEIHPGTTLSLAIFDKFTNLIITVILGLLGIFLLTQNYQFTYHRAIKEIVFFIFIGFLLCFILSPSIIKNIFRRFINVSSLNTKEYLKIFGLSILFYSIFLMQFLLIVLSFQTVNPFYATEAAASVFLVKTLLPISIGDLGIRESAAVFFFGKIGLSMAAAFNASLMLFLINIGLPTLFGLWLLLKNPTQKSK